ncbi:MAG: hypothetical protein COA45_01195 [Zetaproteobacteria bacterium]|nr:MAG: hypothetical protein COA45_01195 [Zetaproteobacteria bacterium]
MAADVMKEDEGDSLLSGGLTKAFSYAVKGAAWYFGFFMLDSFLDFGLLHSSGFAASPIADLSNEFMSPISNAMPQFFSEGFGSGVLEVLTEVLKGIHRLFGVTDTFLDESFLASSDLISDGSLGSFFGGGDVEFGTSTDLGGFELPF